MRFVATIPALLLFAFLVMSSAPSASASTASTSATPLLVESTPVAVADDHLRDSLTSENVDFGHSMRPLFMLADGYYNMNHGSFGAMPRAVWKAQQALVEQAEAKPDVWFRGSYQALLASTRERLATYLNADAADVVLVENASSGVNAVLRSLLVKSGPGDVVLYLQTAYDMVKNTIRWLHEREGLTPVQVNFTLPLSGNGKDAYVQAVTAALATYGARVKLAIFSHISSVPAIIVPVEELTALCKAKGVGAVMIDGAHAIGHIPIDIKALAAAGADFYVANGHKWLYSPKGSAVLWVSPRFQQQYQVVPTVISSTGKWDFVGEFEYTGTRDYTPFCAMSAALDFRQSIGGDAPIMSYVRTLAWNGGQHLASAWKTQTMAPQSMTAGMVDVELPRGASPAAYQALNDRLLKEHDTYLVVYHLVLPSGVDAGWWTRVSAQVYLEMSDFERIAQLVLQLLNV